MQVSECLEIVKVFLNAIQARYRVGGQRLHNLQVIDLSRIMIGTYSA